MNDLQPQEQQFEIITDASYWADRMADAAVRQRKAKITVEKIDQLITGLTDRKRIIEGEFATFMEALRAEVLATFKATGETYHTFLIIRNLKDMVYDRAALLDRLKTLWSERQTLRLMFADVFTKARDWTDVSEDELVEIHFRGQFVASIPADLVLKGCRAYAEQDSPLDAALNHSITLTVRGFEKAWKEHPEAFPYTEVTEVTNQVVAIQPADMSALITPEMMRQIESEGLDEGVI